MPIHDWTRVDAGVFHHFHVSWIVEIKRSLNKVLLPREYYALAERVTADLGLKVLSIEKPVEGSSSGEPEPSGGISVAEAPPRVFFQAQAESHIYAARANRIAIRHQSRHQLIAVIEILPPGSKDGRLPFAAFVHRVEQALRSGIHLLIVDLFPPTARAPDGIHRVIWGGESDGDFSLPGDRPLTCVSYVGYPGMAVYLEPTAVGDPLPDMPLFLTPRIYVPLPLEATYMGAWEAVPGFLRETLSAPPADGRKKG